MLAKETFPLVIKNYFYKKRLHEKAIKNMLGSLTDEELEEGNIDLVKFMCSKTLEKKSRKKQAMEIKNRMIFESQI